MLLLVCPGQPDSARRTRLSQMGVYLQPPTGVLSHLKLTSKYILAVQRTLSFLLENILSWSAPRHLRWTSTASTVMLAWADKSKNKTVHSQVVMFRSEGGRGDQRAERGGTGTPPGWQPSPSGLQRAPTTLGLRSVKTMGWPRAGRTSWHPWYHIIDAFTQI